MKQGYLFVQGGGRARCRPNFVGRDICRISWAYHLVRDSKNIFVTAAINLFVFLEAQTITGGPCRHYSAAQCGGTVAIPENTRTDGRVTEVDIDPTFIRQNPKSLALPCSFLNLPSVAFLHVSIALTV